MTILKRRFYSHEKGFGYYLVRDTEARRTYVLCEGTETDNLDGIEPFSFERDLEDFVWSGQHREQLIELIGQLVEQAEPSRPPATLAEMRDPKFKGR